MRPQLFLVEAVIEPRGSVRRRMFSAKLVKRMLIGSSPAVESLFSPARGPAPKLIHVSPLYTIAGGKVRTVLYTDQIPDLPSTTFLFYVGLVEAGEAHLLLNAVYNLPYIDEASLAGSRFGVSVGRINRVDVESAARDYVEKLRTRGKIKLIFSSPTVLRDPIARLKHKTLIPSTMNIFSTPTYIMLHARNALTYKSLMKTLLTIHRALSVPPTYLQTVRKLDLFYEPNRKIPTLIGYINLHYNPDNDPKGAALGALKETLPYMLALGTGVGRATGLGHITIYKP